MASFHYIGKEELEGVPQRDNTPRRQGCLVVRETSAVELNEGLALGDLGRSQRSASEILPHPLGGAAARFLDPSLVIADGHRGELVAIAISVAGHESGDVAHELLDFLGPLRPSHAERLSD